MVEIQPLALVSVGILNMGLSLFVLMNNTKKASNLAFAFISLGLGGWTIGIAGFLLSNDLNLARVWAKIYYLFPQVVAISIILFAHSFGRSKPLSRKLLLAVSAGFLAVIVPLLFIPDFLTQEVVARSWGKEVILNKYHYLLYTVYLLTCLLGAEYIMLKKSRSLSGVYKVQARIFFVGFLTTGILGVLFNLIFPWFGNYRLIWLGPLFTSVFVIAISYSIIKHRMFDVRLVVARSLGYLLSISMLGVVYGLLAFSVIDTFFFRGSNSSIAQQTTYTLLAVSIAFTFQPLKKFFDKITNRVFYRDAYDAQTLIDELNQVIVSTIDLNKMLKLSSDILESNLKPEFCVFGLKETNFAKQRIIGESGRKFSYEDIAFARKSTPKIHQKVLVADHLDSTDRELQKRMHKNDVAILVRLTPDLEAEGIGYIVLGAKKSGNMYNSHDIKVLEIIANSMVIAINNALRFEEIQKFNVTLQENIDSATHELRATNEKLKALDETKDEFISMASHQLRTPLTSVKGYLSMVLEGDAGKITPAQERLLNQAFTSSQRMVYLISDLLNVSRLRTGKFVIETSPTDLSEVVDTELDQLRETAAARGLKLIYKKPKDFPILELDETKIRQVIMNFVDNAIYYTPSGGEIKIELEAKPSAVELRVIDSGIGVPKAKQHQLFGKFYRADNAKRMRPDGTGLGLFMAKKVVIAQGGAIIFKSTEGKGSTFGFTFPRNKLETKT